MICELVYPVKLILDSILIHPECFTLTYLLVALYRLGHITRSSQTHPKPRLRCVWDDLRWTCRNKGEGIIGMAGT